MSAHRRYKSIRVDHPNLGRSFLLANTFLHHRHDEQVGNADGCLKVKTYPWFSTTTGWQA